MTVSDWFSGIAVIVSGASFALAYWNRQTSLTNETIAGPRVQHWSQKRGLNEADYRVVEVDIKNDPNGYWETHSIQLIAPGYALFSQCGVPVPDELNAHVDYEPVEWFQNVDLDASEIFLAKPYNQEISALVTLRAKSDDRIKVVRKVKLPV